MSRLPRLLPLIAVAVGGVVAVRAAASLEAAPAFLSGSTAVAAEPVGKAPPAKAPAAKAAAPASAETVAATAPAPSGPAVCAPTAAELAKEAGLSPAELRVLQSLQARRGELDAREQGFQTQIALLAAAEAKLDAKVKALDGLKGEIEGLLGQADQREEAEITRLVKVYESMKPKDAAAVMATLDDRVRLPVAARMKERNLAAVLAQMPPRAAKELTEKLAARFDADTLQRRAEAAGARPPAAAPARG